MFDSYECPKCSANGQFSDLKCTNCDKKKLVLKESRLFCQHCETDQGLYCPFCDAKIKFKFFRKSEGASWLDLLWMLLAALILLIIFK